MHRSVGAGMLTPRSRPKNLRSAAIWWRRHVEKRQTCSMASCEDDFEVIFVLNAQILKVLACTSLVPESISNFKTSKPNAVKAGKMIVQEEMMGKLQSYGT